MTGPIIPAELWPEWADRHCWDERGIGQFIGFQTDKYSWRKWAANSSIPRPSGWDWRVPVMRSQSAVERALPATRRQQAVELLLAKGYRWQDGEWKEPQQSPAIDLEQFRVAVEAYKFDGKCKLLEFCFGPEADKQAAIAQIADGDRLLALIDGRASVRSSSEQCSQAAQQGRGGVMTGLESCSLCGLYFATERELAEHRHEIDDGSEDDEQPSKGEGE